jgi:MFS family permease
MASVDQTIVATALPALQHDLGAPVNWSSWTLTIYALGQIMMMPLAGKLGDHYGRKQVFLAAAVLFTGASLACGFAGNIYLLVILRAVQAIGGGAFLPSATGIVAHQFGRDRDRALGLFSSVFPMGGIIGPVLGGVFVTYWSWRGIFLVNVPLGLVLIGLGAVFIPRLPRTAKGPLDLPGVALLGGTLLAAMYGVASLGSGTSPTAPAFLLPEALAVTLLILFARHSARAKAPFIPAKFLVGRGFGVMNLINFLYGCAALGFGALVPLYAENRFGIPTLGAGTLLTARAVGMVTVAAAAVYYLRRTGYRRPMVAGFACTAAGLLVLSASPAAGLTPYAWLAAGAALSGIGMGISTPAANNATLQLAPEHSPVVAGLRGMFRQTGAITAVSVTSAILARSGDPGLAQARVFLIFAVVLVAVLPLIALVPDHRGSW